MSAYLLDTNVISMFAPGKPDPSGKLKAWMIEKGDEDALFISAVTIAEIQKGIHKAHRKGATAKSAQLSGWLEGMLRQFADRILPLDAAVAMIAGALDDEAEGKGLHPGLGDVLIAATAATHGLVVVTRNVRHFEPLGVSVEPPAI